MEDLHLLDQSPPERRDAARNRGALLEAAQELLDDSGVESLTMDAVAQRAGVGKGTLFRRFGSRKGLMGAVLDLFEREFQQSVLFGPPPLGPGAAPWDRLVAFGESRLRHNLRQAELIRAAGYPGIGNTATFSFSSLHVQVLLRELGVTGDLDYLASALIAPLELRVFRPSEEDQPAQRAAHAGWTELARRIVVADSGGE